MGFICSGSQRTSHPPNMTSQVYEITSIPVRDGRPLSPGHGRFIDSEHRAHVRVEVARVVAVGKPSTVISRMKMKMKVIRRSTNSMICQQRQRRHADQVRTTLSRLQDLRKICLPLHHFGHLALALRLMLVVLKTSQWPSRRQSTSSNMRATRTSCSNRVSLKSFTRCSRNLMPTVPQSVIRTPGQRNH